MAPGESTLPPVRFDPEVDCSPYELFRRLREDDPPALYDLRADPEITLRGARPVSADRPESWRPEEGEAVLVDDDGTAARAAVQALRARGVRGVRALFGGLRLYDHALDPRVVGEERYLF